MNIYQRINKVMQSVRYVQKDAMVERYKAVSHDQVVSVAREELVKQGIVIYPEQTGGGIAETLTTKSGGRMALYAGEYVVHFVNIEDPADRISVPVQAHAMDNGDKAPGKAVTYATKTAILKVLCLETGENDESRADIREASQPISDDQASQLRARLEALGRDEIKFCQWAKVPSLADIPAGRLPAISAKLDQVEAANGDA